MAITAAEVETAITKIMTTGQSVSVDGMTYSQASISALISLREKLKAEAAATTTRPTFRAFNISSMGYD